MATFTLSKNLETYSLECENFQTACVVNMFLTRGFFELKGIEKGAECVMPILAFTNYDKWFQKTFGKTFASLLNKESLVAGLKSIIAEEQSHPLSGSEQKTLISHPLCIEAKRWASLIELIPEEITLTS